jgi:phage terminase large subunit-like protein
MKKTLTLSSTRSREKSKYPELAGYFLYQDSVLSGKATVCEYVRLAVQRQHNDLQKADFDYYFDLEEAARAVRFIRLLKHTKGTYAGKPFMLTDWQVWHISVLLGWRHKVTHARRFTRAYMEVARKNGKSELAAAILLYLTVADDEAGAECYSVATTRDQAAISFKAAKEMARQLRLDSKAAAGYINIFKHSVSTKTNSFMQALSSDAHTLDGLNPHGAIIDEYHEHRTNALPSVIETGTGSRAQPLLYIITTAGFHKEYPCYTEERYNAIQVLQGHRQEDSLFTMIYTLDDDDDWQDESVWIKANPNIGQTPTWDYMRRAAKTAKNRGESARVQFQTKNLNKWSQTSSVWIKPEVWKARKCAEIPEMRGLYLGIDLASVSDLTSVCFLCELPNDRLLFRWLYFVAEETAKTRSENDGVPYLDWAAQGHIILTPGNVTDYRVIREHVNKLHDASTIIHSAIDPYNSWQIASDIEGDGIKIETYRQGFLSLSEPTKQFERGLLSGVIEHDGNPVTEWMLGNVELERDAAGNIKPSKKKSREKIDGITAAVTALGGYLVEKGKPLGGTYLTEEEEIFMV